MAVAGLLPLSNHFIQAKWKEKRANLYLYLPTSMHSLHMTGVFQKAIAEQM